MMSRLMRCVEQLKEAGGGGRGGGGEPESEVGEGVAGLRQWREVVES